MMNNNTHSTLLEQLPIEIFLEIFASFSLSEIVTTFSGLNSYIDTCIQAVTNSTHVLTYNDTTSVNLLNSFPRQINRLIITHSPTVDFTLLTNIRSLTLKYGTPTQFDGIRPQNFPRLEILHLCGINGNSTMDKTKPLDDLFEMILSNGFPRLRICTIVGFQSLTPNSVWSGSRSLRVLILDLRTEFDYEQIRTICPNLRPYQSSLNFSFDIGQTEIIPPVYKRLRREMLKLKEWESEKKFILESCSTFNKTSMHGKFYSTEFNIRGRIFPKKEPYCFASFLIEIKLPPEYPFKVPDITILDTIYHPNIRVNGKPCCCWFENGLMWRPPMPLVDIIKGFMSLIDNFTNEHYCGAVDSNEYLDNYDKFYEKALRWTFDYGRPRF